MYSDEIVTWFTLSFCPKPLFSDATMVLTTQQSTMTQLTTSSNTTVLSL